MKIKNVNVKRVLPKRGNTRAISTTKIVMLRTIFVINPEHSPFLLLKSSNSKDVYIYVYKSLFIETKLSESHQFS